MLSCGNVGKTYATERGDIVAVSGIDLTVPRGQFAAIVGRSGSGKSSLMAMIGGLSRPTHGAVMVENTDIWALPDDALAEFRNRRIGFVFQFASLLPALRIIDNVALPALLGRRADANAAYGRAAELLDGLGLAEHSTPIRRRFRRASSAAPSLRAPSSMRPRCCSPTSRPSDLDEQTEMEIMDRFRDLNRDRAMTLLVVTHNLRLAERADRIFHIANGGLVA